MAHIVGGRTIVDAWLDGCALLEAQSAHDVSNLITEIREPAIIDPGWDRRFDPRSVGGKDRLSVVSKVLFPANPKPAHETRFAYYDRHAKLLKRARSRGTLYTSWGSTYFERLISLDGSENQIERAIRVLNKWQRRSETAIVAHLSSPSADSLRKRGAPCLQYIEILWRVDDSLDLVAVYRNHDFVNKVLGNFIGLARLLKFVAAESNKNVGTIVCHSVHAYGNPVGQLRSLMGH